MIEILFRAKRKNWRELPKEEWWVEGDVIHEPYGVVIQYYVDKRRIKVIIDPETLCQHTGKTDETGKKIYEKDIVGFIDLTSTESGYSESSCLGEVIWSKEGCCFHATNRLSAESWEVLDECKVVGNIFDNPELLE